MQRLNKSLNDSTKPTSSVQPQKYQAEPHSICKNDTFPKK